MSNVHPLTFVNHDARNSLDKHINASTACLKQSIRIKNSVTFSRKMDVFGTGKKCDALGYRTELSWIEFLHLTLPMEPMEIMKFLILSSNFFSKCLFFFFILNNIP